MRSNRDAMRREQISRRAILAAGCLVLFALASVTASRLLGYKWEWRPDGTVVAQRAISFEQGDDGVVSVRDARTGEVLGNYPFNKNAFMRTVMLSFRHERARVTSTGLAREHRVPFNIEQWDDGRVTVSDPVSGRSIEMAAFGRHQVETFAALLH